MSRPLSSVTGGLIVALLLVLAGCAASGEDGSNGDAEPTTTATPAPTTRVVRVETAVVQPTTFEDVVQITGTIEAPNDASLSAQAGGTLEYIAPLGRTVGRGAVVARMDSELLAAALRQAEAILEVQKAQENLAQDNFNRQEPLFQDSIISALEFESVRTQLIQARAQRSQAESAVAQATKALDNTRVLAPFSGTVEEHYADAGEQLLPGSQVLRLVNTSRVNIVAGVPERYASDIQVGSGARASFSAYGIPDIEGVVRFASRVIDPQSRTFRVEVEVNNPDGALKPAMIANLLVTRAVLDQRLVVPITAVLREEDRSSVFVVTSPGDGTVQVAERRPVVLGASYRGLAVVESGLQAGDEIIVVGQTNVTEGDAIEIANRTTTE
ncbi:MAG: efflux RND transporter periplasmic adaptor subunit [Rhodothermales bacterium]|nr:efflux RND transporter periplasmic adaptor subunit [Rhodothermales bacterium]MBO6781350.1 efflux RND transporter periplasmic adaptor subunit [Rhodothermales bacterium]